MTSKHGYPPPDPDDEYTGGVGTAIAFVLFVLIVAALLTHCSEAKASVPAFLLNLPDGTSQHACTAHYDARAKQYDFGPCNVTVFADSFEGG